MTATIHPYLATSMSPGWAEDSGDESVGVDFLGTRAVNLEMLTALTGHYNNTVVSARQHAILVWAMWRYRKNCAEKNRGARRSEFFVFLEAIETIQLVGQITFGRAYGGTAGGLGANAAKNLGNDKEIPLRFEAYARTSQTSALAAVQYGPSAKTNSFGFIGGGVDGIWVPTPRGEKIALALDSLLRRSSAYAEFTKETVPERMLRSDVVDLAAQGLVIGTSLPERPERTPYREALFDLDGLSPVRNHPRRLTLALFLAIVSSLDEGDGVTPTALRHFLLAGRTQTRRTSLAPYLHKVSAQWQILQVRQIQRYMLECWLTIVEGWMQEGEIDVTRMRRRLEDDLRNASPLGSDLASKLGQPNSLATAYFEGHRGSADVAGWAASSDETAPWCLYDAVSAALSANETEKATCATVLLTFAVLTLIKEFVPAAGPLLDFASLGGRRRISLPEFHKWWLRRDIYPLGDVLAEMIDELILQQHVAVAVARFDNEQRRLRFCNDERGWQLLPGTEVSIAGITPDRIQAFMALLADVDVFQRADDGSGEAAYSITEVGEELSRRVAAAAAI